MSHIVPRAAAASATLLALLGLSIGTAQGDGVIETIYVDPTAYVVPSTYMTTSSLVSTGPTYLAPTAYVVPSAYSYVLPSSYETTAYTYLPTSASYYVPSTYETTYYRRPGPLRRLFGRRWVETSRAYSYDVMPTVAYQPTTFTYDSPVTATVFGTACNESPVAFQRPMPVNPGNGDSNSGSITSQPKAQQDPNYYDSTPEKPKAATTDTAKPKAAAASPPENPVAPARDANGAGNLSEPPADLPKSVVDPQDRSSFKPKPTELKARAGSSSLNVLRGEVVSGLLGKKEPGLEVVFSDRKGTFRDRTKTTDDAGAFEVFLPNGSWAIKVVDPKGVAGGNVREYGEVTSTGGQYLDDKDSPIYSLRLSH